MSIVTVISQCGTGFRRVKHETSSLAVRALDRGLSLLEAFTPSRPALTLADLAAAVQLPKATVFRLVATLVRCGYLERVGDRYEIGLKCFHLASTFRGSIDLRRRALPELIALRDATGETVQLAVSSGPNIVYLERVFSQKPVGYMRSTIGAVLPAYCTGLGKCLLAFLQREQINEYFGEAVLERLTPNTIIRPELLRAELARVRTRGYATDLEERELGVRCVAAPVFDDAGECVAAISVAGPVDRLPVPLDDAHPAVRAVVAAARRVSASLGCPAYRVGVAG